MESENHRITEVGRDLIAHRAHFAKTPLRKQDLIKSEIQYTSATKKNLTDFKEFHDLANNKSLFFFMEARKSSGKNFIKNLVFC